MKQQWDDITTSDTKFSIDNPYYKVKETEVKDAAGYDDFIYQTVLYKIDLTDDNIYSSYGKKVAILETHYRGRTDPVVLSQITLGSNTYILVSSRAEDSSSMMPLHYLDLYKDDGTALSSTGIHGEGYVVEPYFNEDNQWKSHYRVCNL